MLQMRKRGKEIRKKEQKVEYEMYHLLNLDAERCA